MDIDMPDIPERLKWPVIYVSIAVVLGIAALVGILLAVGNDEENFTPTVQTAAVRKLASAAAVGGTIDVPTVAITPSTGWKLQGKGTYYIDLIAPQGLGLLGVESGKLKNPTLTTYAQYLVGQIQKRASAAKLCGQAKQAKVPNGPNGVLIPICWTFVPQNRKAVNLFTFLYVGVSGQVGVAMSGTTLQNTNALKAFLQAAGPVAGTVRWKLLQL